MSLVYLRKKSNFNQKKPDAFSNLRIVKDQILVDIEYSAQAANGNSGKMAVCDVVSDAVPDAFKPKFRLLTMETFVKTVSLDQMEALKQFYVELGYPETDLDFSLSSEEEKKLSMQAAFEAATAESDAAALAKPKPRSVLRTTSVSYLSSRLARNRLPATEPKQAETVASDNDSVASTTSQSLNDSSAHRRRPGRPPKSYPDAKLVSYTDFPSAAQPQSVSQQVMPLRFRVKEPLPLSNPVESLELLRKQPFKDTYELATPLEILEGKSKVKKRKRNATGELKELPEHLPLPVLDKATVQSIVTPPASPATYNDASHKKSALGTPGQLSFTAVSSKDHPDSTLNTPPASPLSFSDHMTASEKQDSLLAQINDQKWLISHIGSSESRIQERLNAVKSYAGTSEILIDSLETRLILYKHRKRLLEEKLDKLQRALDSLLQSKQCDGAGKLDSAADVESDACEVIDRELDLLSHLEQRTHSTRDYSGKSNAVESDTDLDAIEAAGILVGASLAEEAKDEGAVYSEMVSLLENLVENSIKDKVVPKVKPLGKIVRTRKRSTLAPSRRGNKDRAREPPVTPRLPSITESSTFLREILNEAVPSMSQLSTLSGVHAALAPQMQTANLLPGLSLNAPPYGVYSAGNRGIYDNYLVGYRNPMLANGFNEMMNQNYYGGMNVSQNTARQTVMHPPKVTQNQNVNGRAPWF